MLKSEYERRLSPKRPSTPPPRKSLPDSPLSLSSSGKLRATYSDRFIPSKQDEGLEAKYHVLPEPSAESKNEDSTYDQILKNEILGTSYGSPKANSSSMSPVSRNLFRFKSEPTIRTPEEVFSPSPLSSSTRKLLASPKKHTRKISKTPFRILEAPEIEDDFYLNLVDWSSQNVIAVGLYNVMYLWNATTATVSKMFDLPSGDFITACSFSERGNLLAVGTTCGEVQIWDVALGKMQSKLQSHNARVSSIAWNGNCVTSGGRDRVILNQDIRSNRDMSSLSAHKQEVCGLRWSPDKQQLASGGNDNKVFIWDVANLSKPTKKFSEHVAAVKALAWSPHQRGLLASGGGTADRCIRIWNTKVENSIKVVDTGSQVCNLAWSKNVDEIVSTHGYSQNQITLWSYPTMTPITTLTGHATRVLYLAVSPDGQNIVTGAGDETLRFWSVFPRVKSSGSTSDLISIKNIRTDIR